MADNTDNIINNIQSGKILPIKQTILTISNWAKIKGCPTLEVHLSGCNLECTYCNPDQLSEVNELISPAELLKKIQTEIENYPEINVLFCGGEPLLYNRNFVYNHIANSLPYSNIFIKTNGSIEIDDIFAENLHYILEYKTPSSNMESSFFIDNVKQLRLNLDCINFTANKQDLYFIQDRILQLLKIKPFLDIYITPYGDLNLSEVSNFILNNRLPVKINM